VVVALGQLLAHGIHPDSSIWRLVLPLVLAGAGTGVLNAVLGRESIASVPPGRAAMGSGAQNTARYLGAAFGITLFVTVAAHTGATLFDGSQRGPGGRRHDAAGRGGDRTDRAPYRLRIHKKYCTTVLVELSSGPMEPEGRVRASIEQVAASGHPVRRRLLELLGVDGPATASRLAEETGELVGNVSHHLKMLARAGLVEEAPELAKDRRERWWRRVPVGLSWSLADVRGDPVGEAVAIAAEHVNLDHHVAAVRGWLVARDSTDRYDESWTAAAFATDTWVRATPDELEELGGTIDALLSEFRAAHQDDAPGRESCYVFAHGVPRRP
jgi:DNA-binding transcriptional ArsR family regulator